MKSGGSKSGGMRIGERIAYLRGFPSNLGFRASPGNSVGLDPVGKEQVVYKRIENKMTSHTTSMPAKENLTSKGRNQRSEQV